MSSSSRQSSADSAGVDSIFDVIIIGAGISGINAAQRVQTLLPGTKYAILEARGAIGGTWAFFKYPGFRSDSDLYTFGFPWRPWNEKKVIAEGELIRNYIQESAEEYGIEKHVLFHHKVASMDWSSKAKTWDLLVEEGEGEKKAEKHMHAHFIILSTGYYDYNAPMDTVVPGIEDFKGIKVHPQFWPEDLDYSGKKLVVIGSGATAVTMVPVLAEKAAKVTMLQRSPSYILSVPTDDGLARWAYRLLPKWLAFHVVRAKFLTLPAMFFMFCSRFPNAARNLLRKATLKQLPQTIGHDPHFNPRYNPWQQRLCMCPDGDFFRALHKGRVEIVTGTIDRVTETGIIVKDASTESSSTSSNSGSDIKQKEEIPADIIITATGLKLQVAGGARISVDGTPVAINNKFLWKGIMLQDIPNVANVVGYANASWTLGAEATAQHVCRLLKYMRSHGYAAACPRVAPNSQLKERPILDLTSTYVMKGLKDMPKTGSEGPWRPRQQYFYDMWQARFGNLREDMEFVSA